METMRERETEVPARRAPVPAMAKGRGRERGVAAGAPARKRVFRGVTLLPSGNYAAEINEPGSTKRRWLGTFSDAKVAARAYDMAARSLQGRKAKTNFDDPLPDDLSAAGAAAPHRSGHVYPAPPPPAPAPAPAVTPPAAPAPVPFEQVHHFSFQAPPGEPALFPTYPCLKDPLGLLARALEPEREAEIPPKPFSIRDYALAASRRVSDPMDLFAPPIRIVAPAREPVPVSSACFSSTTDPQLRASASSSRRMVSNSRHLMLKTPKIFAVPASAPTHRTSDEGFTGDNFTGVNAVLFQSSAFSVTSARCRRSEQ